MSTAAATVGYGRVSTASGEQLSALRSQLAWLEEQHCDTVLHDVESGLNVDRHNYTTLLRLVETKAVSVICATRADRLGRDANELVRLVQLADAAGIVVTTRDDGTLSAKTAEELLLLFVRAALAQGESMKLSKRVCGGLEQGRKLGRPMRKPCWGYSLSSDRMRLEPHPEDFPRARRLIDWLIQNQWRVMPTFKGFPEPLPFVDSRGINCWLNNPTIRGALAYNRKAGNQYEEIQWDRHPALLSHSEYEAYQVRAKLNRQQWGCNSRREVRPLTGLCICGNCGYKLHYRNRTTTRLTLRCNSVGVCPYAYRSTREEAIIYWVIEQLTQRAAEYLSNQASKDEDPAAIELRRQITSLEALQMNDVQPLIEQKQAKLASILKAPTTNEEMIRKVSDKKLWDLASRDELSDLLHATVKEITVYDQQPVKLQLRF